MTGISKRAPRSDATNNRTRIIDAARSLFAERGYDVPLDDVAVAANVSRTTLYRNFDSREELASFIFNQNITEMENEAARLSEMPGGIVTLFDFVLDLQLTSRAIASVLSRTMEDSFIDLAARARGALAPLVEAGLHSGHVQPGVTLEDVVLAVLMSEVTVSGPTGPNRAELNGRARAILHRGLFRQPSPR